MPKRIPIAEARRFGQQNGCSQVIVAAWDGERTHFLSWGKSAEDCARAAAGCNALKDALGLPELRAEPARVRKLLERIAALEAGLAAVTQMAEMYTFLRDNAVELSDVRDDLISQRPPFLVFTVFNPGGSPRDDEMAKGEKDGYVQEAMQKARLAQEATRA